MPTAGKIYYFASKENGNGSKPPIILVHGAGGCGQNWPHHLRRLEDWRVLAPDLPGHGKSDGLGEHSIAKYVNTLIDWMNDIGVHQAIFVGHSMGGAIVQSLALEHPDRVAALAIIGSGPRLEFDETLMSKLSRKESMGGAIDKIIEQSYFQTQDKRLLQQAKEQLENNRPAVIHGDYVASVAFDIRERLAEIAVPTLIICGEEDQITPARFSQKLADGIPNAQLTLIPESGHMVMLEKPQAVAEAFTAFLDKVFQIA